MGHLMGIWGLEGLISVWEKVKVRGGPRLFGQSSFTHTIIKLKNSKRGKTVLMSYLLAVTSWVA